MQDFAYLCGMLNRFFLLLLFLHPFISKSGDKGSFTNSKDHVDLYRVLALSEKGLSYEAYQLALTGFYKLKSKGKLQNPDILTIVDFSQSSRNKRLYVIDLAHKKLLFNTYVTHGMKTGLECADFFSNAPGSKKSSLGFYLTKEKQIGQKVGISLVLEGLEKGFNDNAQKRGIIMHGGVYATEKVIKASGKLGRSYGCPVLPPDQIEDVIESIKNGTCLFIYQHDNQYLSSSTFLN